MRNTTKLKHVLQLYTMTFDISDDGLFHLMLIDKQHNEEHHLTDKTYSGIVSKAYSLLLKGLKAREKGIR